jgi:hypothetical protein
METQLYSEDTIVIKENIATINQCIANLIFDKPLNQFVQPKDLRGAISHMKINNALFHQHINDESLVYDYPLIQYKIIERIGIIVGLDKGAVPVAKMNLLKKQMNLGNIKYIVEQQTLSFFVSHIGIQDRNSTYKFLHPWLALNEKNYEKYQRYGTWKQKKALLEKILVGNILSVSKSLGYTVPAPIEANIINIKEVPTMLKGTPMLGFLGTFSVNFEIPDYWGIGKSVSRGFGTVKRIDSSDGASGIDKRDDLM